MIKKIAKFSLLCSLPAIGLRRMRWQAGFFFLLPTAVFAAEISGNTPGEFVSNFYNFALLISGALAFGAIVYGGIKYTFAAGNPSGQSEGKDWVKSALLGLLLLAAAGLVLRTINPKILDLTVAPLPPGNPLPPPPGGGPNPTSTALCNNPQELAKQNNEPYPPQRSTALQNLITCIASRTGYPMPFEGGSNAFYGSVYTVDHTYPLCNFTRGQRTCSDCSHSVGSCHYGGASGSDGALAVDFGNQANIGLFKQAAIACGTTASHVIFEGDHVHISSGYCSGN